MCELNFLFENSLFEFSRNNCLAICGFLVPANILATLQTLIFVGRKSPEVSTTPIIMMSVIYAIAMILHVFTWFVAGVVMPPTFILLGLGITCLSINIWAIAFPLIMNKYLVRIWNFGLRYFASITPKSSNVATKFY